MDIMEINKMISLIGSFGIGFFIGGGIIFLFIKSFIPSYLSEKAKNLASKEDIASITDKVESVKADYAKILEEIKSNYQLRQAAIEREKILKKEVYMDALEAITRSHRIISGFFNLKLSQDQITSSLRHDAGKVAKIQVVGSKEIVRAVTILMAEINSAALDLIFKRNELVSRQNSINNYQSYMEKAKQEIDQYIAIIKNLNFQTNTDQHLLDTLGRNIEFEQEKYKKYSTEIDIKWDIQKKELLQFTRVCMNRYFEITKLLPSVILATRNDLDLEIESKDYLDILNEKIENDKKNIENFLSRIEIGN